MAVVDFLSRIGCIGFSVEAKLVRCTDRKNSDRKIGNVRRSHLTCIGALTEASERISFVQCVGPTSAGYEWPSEVALRQPRRR